MPLGRSFRTRLARLGEETGWAVGTLVALALAALLAPVWVPASLWGRARRSGWWPWR